MSTTIAAVSTPVAAGGIGVIRISGDEAVTVADQVFTAFSGKKLSSMKGYTAAYGKVHNEKGETVDECVALVFRAPKSYTGENTVEISCHGGILVTQQVLRCVLAAGAVAAGAGEFTKRAFLNGKMDLSEAEAVMSLISAQGEQGMKAALTALDGALSKKIRTITDELVSASAHMAAWVDYPDEEIPELSDESLQMILGKTETELSAMLSKFDAGQAITSGVDTAIIGKPNVGKSALMNMLTGFRRSIVTDIAGTTRDIVEETVRLGNVILRLADTAGIRESDDVVESIGVDMAKTRLERAGLILAVFDSSAPLDESDREIIELCRGRDAVAVINKTDLPCQADTAYLLSAFSHVVFVSAKTHAGEKKLIEAVEEMLGTDQINTAEAMLTTERQRISAVEALDCIRQAKDALENGVTLDAVNVCIDRAVDHLLALTGERAGEAVVNEVFSRFCVGK